MNPTDPVDQQHQLYCCTCLEDRPHKDVRFRHEPQSIPGLDVEVPMLFIWKQCVVCGRTFRYVQMRAGMLEQIVQFLENEAARHSNRSHDQM